MFPQKLKSFFTKPIFKFKVNYGFFNPAKWNWQKIKEFLKIFLLTSTLFLVFLIIYAAAKEITPADEQLADDISEKVIDYLDENNLGYEETPEGNCNVLGIDLHGSLITYIPPEDFNEGGENAFDETASQNIVSSINEAKKDKKIKAIILEIDSPGGSAVAAEEVANALKNSGKPTVVLIRNVGASAAYYAATGANIIFASQYSDVGSIGVDYSYLDNVEKNRKEGINFNQISTGKFKTTGDPNKPLTAEEKALYMRDALVTHEKFVKAVAENRKLDIEKVEKLADGSTLLGEAALQNGLIDRIGSFKEVEEYVEEKIGEEIEVCW